MNTNCQLLSSRAYAELLYFTFSSSVPILSDVNPQSTLSATCIRCLMRPQVDLSRCGFHSCYTSGPKNIEPAFRNHQWYYSDWGTILHNCWNVSVKHVTRETLSGAFMLLDFHQRMCNINALTYIKHIHKARIQILADYSWPYVMA